MEQLGVDVLSHVSGDLAVVLSDGVIELSKGSHQVQHGQAVGRDHRRVRHQRQGRPHECDPPILSLVIRHAAPFGEQPGKGPHGRPPQLRMRGKLLEQMQEPVGVQVGTGQIQRQRKILLEPLAEAVFQGRALIHPVPPIFHQPRNVRVKASPGRQARSLLRYCSRNRQSN